MKKMKTKKVLLMSLTALIIILGMSSASLAKDIVLKLGHIFTPTSAIAECTQMVADLVKLRSNGSLKIEIFPGGQLGAQLDEVEGVKMGTQDITILGAIDRFAPNFTMFNLPFMYRDMDHCYDVLTGPLGKKYILDDLVERHGIYVPGFFYFGVRMLTTDAKHPVTKPEDVKGIKLRTPDMKAWIKSWQSIGANVTAFPWGELYMALKQGVVEAQENPLPAIRDMKFYEVQKNIILTKHIYDYTFILMNNKKWKSLDKNQQDILVQALKAGLYYSRGRIAREEAVNVNFFKKEGINIVEVDTAEWQKAFSKAPDLFEGGREIYEKVQDVK
jgi:tripartite ATP-independent transporter DctP family solute receptor